MTQFKVLSSSVSHLGVVDIAVGSHSFLGKGIRVFRQATQSAATRNLSARALGKLMELFKEHLDTYQNNKGKFRFGEEPYLSRKTQLQTKDDGGKPRSHSVERFWETFRDKAMRIEDAAEFNDHHLVKTLRALIADKPDVLIEMILVGAQSIISKRASVGTGHRERLLDQFYDKRTLPVSPQDSFNIFEDWLSALPSDVSQGMEVFLTISGELLSLVQDQSPEILDLFEKNILAPVLLGTVHKPSRAGLVEKSKGSWDPSQQGASLVDVVLLRCNRMTYARHCMNAESWSAQYLLLNFKHAFPGLGDQLKDVVSEKLSPSDFSQALTDIFGGESFKSQGPSELSSSKKGRLMDVMIHLVGLALDEAKEKGQSLDGVSLKIGMFLLPDGMDYKYKELGREVVSLVSKKDNEVFRKVVDFSKTAEAERSVKPTAKPSAMASSAATSSARSASTSVTYSYTVPAQLTPADKASCCRILDALTNNCPSLNRSGLYQEILKSTADSVDAYIAQGGVFSPSLYVDTFNNVLSASLNQNPQSSFYLSLGQLLINCTDIISDFSSSNSLNLDVTRPALDRLWETLKTSIFFRFDSASSVLNRLFPPSLQGSTLFKYIFVDALVRTAMPDEPSNDLRTLEPLMRNLVASFKNWFHTTSNTSLYALLPQMVDGLTQVLQSFQDFRIREGSDNPNTMFDSLTDVIQQLLPVYQSRQIINTPQVTQDNLKFYGEILGLTPDNLTQDSVKKAYRKLMMKLHPDKNKQEANEDDTTFAARDAVRKNRYDAVQSAYNFLMDKGNLPE